MINKAYGKFEFETNIKLIQLVFHFFEGDKKQKCFNIGSDKDTLDLIDTYMKSEVRKKMDEGDYVAHYYGGKQVYNRIDKTNCKPKTMTYDLDILHWMAEVYCTLQWTYCIYSKDIDSFLPARDLYAKYEAMKDLPMEDCCKQLYETVLADKDLPNTPPYKGIDIEEVEYDN